MLRFLLLCLLPTTLGAQVFDRLNYPVSEADVPLAFPFAGGLNAPQYSAVDWNQDGTDDLYVFDRVGNVQLAFVRTAEGFVYSPEYLVNFPQRQHFMLLRDYNVDGVPDLFAHYGSGISGLVVYTGSLVNGLLQFEQVDSEWSVNSEVLPYPTSGTDSTQLYVPITDIPGVADLDGDGDLDILSFGTSGSYVYEYRNVSVEETGSPGLRYELHTTCWGKFLENSFSEEVTLSDDPDACAEFLQDPKGGGGASARHSGSTVLIFDANGDGLPDAALGDLASARLNLVVNGGTTDEAWITETDPFFPSYDVPAELPIFTAGFYVDTDADGTRDLLVAPNIKGNSEDRRVTWRYTNTGTDAAPVFEYLQEDFLVENTIDLGTNAFPVCFDADADGLLDILVANGTYYSQNGPQGRLFLYRNVGSATAPAFALADDDYLDFSQYGGQSNTFIPTTGDLDGDGDLDILVGVNNGFSDGTLAFLENTAGSGNAAAFAAPVFDWQGIDVGQRAAPELADLDRDGDLDLLIGERTGQVNYFPNQGSATDPVFLPLSDPANNQFFGEIDATAPGTTSGRSVPRVLQFADRTLLFVGSRTGAILQYEVDETQLDGGPFELLSAQYGEVYVGEDAAPALADLDGDGFFDLLVGNVRGGFGGFATNLSTDGFTAVGTVPEVAGLRVFPNPTTSRVQFDWRADGAAHLRVVDALGRVVLERPGLSSTQSVDLRTLGGGLYTCELTQGAARSRVRVLVVPE